MGAFDRQKSQDGTGAVRWLVFTVDKFNFDFHIHESRA